MSGSVVTVGTYDGVHLGHRALIRRAIELGGELCLPVKVVTFDRNPLEVVRPDRTPKMLTDLELKVELLWSLEVSDVVVLTFDGTRAAQSAEDFVTDELVTGLGAKAILVGSNFRFGHRQRGDIALLQTMAPSLGFVAHGIGLVSDGATSEIVSSSAIRDHIAAGDLHRAARLLGRPHEVRGCLDKERDERVVLVDGRLALPPPGAYDVEARFDTTAVRSKLQVIDDDGEPMRRLVLDAPSEREASRASCRFI
jgi:riboflavin kinase/FMN adenylyltransferase